jgi:hypothetical protein
VWKDWALREGEGCQGGKGEGEAKRRGVGLYGWDVWGFKDERLGDEGKEMEGYGETKEGVKGRVYGKERRRGRGRA